jgi:hypothetical protein
MDKMEYEMIIEVTKNESDIGFDGNVYPASYTAQAHKNNQYIFGVLGFGSTAKEAVLDLTTKIS